jgi:hypothetical protein
MQCLKRAAFEAIKGPPYQWYCSVYKYLALDKKVALLKPIAK